MAVSKDKNAVIAQNKKAYHDYFVLEKYEAGILLKKNLKPVLNLPEQKLSL